MSDPPGIGINYGNIVTWAIVVLGMGITYGTLYGTLRGSVDSIGEINNRQDQFVISATELLSNLQLQNVQTTADLRQVRETVVAIQQQIVNDRKETNATSEFLQQQINDLRNTLMEHDRNVADLRAVLDEVRRYRGMSNWPTAPDEQDNPDFRPRSPPVEIYRPPLRSR